VKKYREIFGAASNNSNHGMVVTETEMSSEENTNTSTASSNNNNTVSHGIAYDAKWATTTLSQSQSQLETLEARLSTAQSHLAKESIRSAYLSLADYSKARGNLKESLKYTLRSRDYCTDVRSSASMCLSVIELGIDLGNYAQVHSYVSKAEHTTDLVNGDSVVAAKLKVASGIALMHDGRYADAANKFTSVSADLDGGMMYPSVASAEDVALYGSLLGLASLDRHSLQISVLDSTLFKQKLELLPWMRDALRHFRLAEYGSCLQILDQHRNTDMMLDLHLSRHASKLLHMVRDRCLVQYFLPYSTVSLDKMANSFGRSVDEIMDAVAALIVKNKIRGRINAQDRTLLARVDNYRGDTLNKVKRLGDDFIRETESMILREYSLCDSLFLCCQKIWIHFTLTFHTLQTHDRNVMHRTRTNRTIRSSTKLSRIFLLLLFLPPSSCP